MIPKKMPLLNSILQRWNNKLLIQKKSTLCVLLLFLFTMNVILNETMTSNHDGAAADDNESNMLFGFKNFRLLPTNRRGGGKRPFVSFIIPSLLRSTLPQTLDSLTLQTDPNWEALIGVDLDIISPLPPHQGTEESSISTTTSDTTLSVDESLPNSNMDNSPVITDTTIDVPTSSSLPLPSSSMDSRNTIINDERISLSMMRNMSHVSNNSAGAVRNRLMPNAKGEWIAFVDDDDTISPCYVEWLKRGLQKLEKEYKYNDEQIMPEVIVFRMYLPVLRRDVPFRKGRGKNVIRLNNVGISFAVKSELLVQPENGFAFEPGSGEDYQLLRSISAQGHRIMIADCTAYFVHAEKWDPNQRTCTQKRESTCQFIDPKNVVV